jgi:flagellar biosynthesis/type III secretory pathway M-ring protein FliF/YscJ
MTESFFNNLLEPKTMNVVRYIIAYGLAVLVFLTFMLPVISSIRSKIADRRERNEFSKKIQDAIEKITADGKIEGPKGRYVPHRRHGALIDHSTKPPKHGGRYNHPWA